ncbi:MAG: DUF2436 domain-containing protein [Muribaculaceae bacterium]|nr:DUF2436 domain-containing protein [Muribaculaceae bacterium]
MKKFTILLLMAALATSTYAAEKFTEPQVKTRHNTTVVTPSVQAIKAITARPASTGMKADVPAGYAMVTLSAGDIWGDGSGYQMLLDADATAFGTIIPETGALTSGGDVPETTYAEFEYKIPENADGALTTANIVFNADVSILVPAGVYDWCITNPTPGDRMWISSSNGTIPGRYDDFEFVDGLTYVFTIGVYGSNDGVALTVLEPGVSLTTPMNVTVDPAATYANVNWEDDDDMLWNIRYRVHNPNEGGFWDFEDDSQLDGWVIYDADGDGDNWYYTTNDLAQSGEYVLASDSYYWGALYPDNWLISPEVALNGELTFYASGSASSWYDEVFRVYVGPTDWESIEDFTPISEDITTGYGMQQYTFDLSEWAGERGVIAIRHYNCSDVYTLLIDDFSIGEPGYEWTTINGIDDLNAVLENLDPETTYEVQVQATGNSGFSSDWSETVIFTTLAEDPAQGIEELYIVGSFNSWNQTEEGGRIPFVLNENNEFVAENVALGGGDEFKLITPSADAPNGWIWFGGLDENQVGYFLITPELLTNAISLVDGSNFRMEEGGIFTITVTEGPRGLNQPLVMTVEDTNPTAIRDLNTEKSDNTWYNIQGMKLNGVPTAAGIYINGGKKVVIK